MHGFRYGDVQRREALAAHRDAGEQQDQAGRDDRKQQGDGDVARRAGQARGHDQEDRGDVPRPARRAAEAHQREGARHGDAGAHIAVDHQDHRGDDDRQHDQGDQEAAGSAALAAEGQSSDDAAEPGEEQAEQILADREAPGQDRTKD